MEVNNFGLYSIFSRSVPPPDQANLIAFRHISLKESSKLIKDKYLDYIGKVSIKKLLVEPAHGFNSQFLNLSGFSIFVRFVGVSFNRFGRI